MLNRSNYPAALTRRCNRLLDAADVDAKVKSDAYLHGATVTALTLEHLREARRVLANGGLDVSPIAVVLDAPRFYVIAGGAR